MEIILIVLLSAVVLLEHIRITWLENDQVSQMKYSNIIAEHVVNLKKDVRFTFDSLTKLQEHTGNIVDAMADITKMLKRNDKKDAK